MNVCVMLRFDSEIGSQQGLEVIMDDAKTPLLCDLDMCKPK